jgi:hypothetical protein
MSHKQAIIDTGNAHYQGLRLFPAFIDHFKKGIEDKRYGKIVLLNATADFLRFNYAGHAISVHLETIAGSEDSQARAFLAVYLTSPEMTAQHLLAGIPFNEEGKTLVAPHGQPDGGSITGSEQEFDTVLERILHAILRYSEMRNPKIHWSA